MATASDRGRGRAGASPALSLAGMLANNKTKRLIAAAVLAGGGYAAITHYQRQQKLKRDVAR